MYGRYPHRDGTIDAILEILERWGRNMSIEVLRKRTQKKRGDLFREGDFTAALWILRDCRRIEWDRSARLARPAT